MRSILAAFLLLLCWPVWAQQQVPNPAQQDTVVGWAANNAALKTHTYKGSPVYRAGFTTAGDGGQATYRYTSNACTAADDGAQVAASGGGCWQIQADANGVDFRVWGAVNGTLVDDPLDAAIAYACATHIPIKFQLPKANADDNYRLNRAHVIGNGSASQNSTCNGVSFISDVIYAEYAMSQGVLFDWFGAANVVPITVKGPMVGVKIRGLAVDCRGICSTGFEINNTLDSEFGWLGVRRQIGPAFIITSTQSNIWHGGNEQVWYHDLIAALPSPGGSGGIIGDTTCTTCNVAVIQSKFDNLALLYDGQTAGTFGLKLGMFVQSAFYGGKFQRVDGLGSLGNSLIVAPPPGGLSYPQDVTFYHSLFDSPIQQGAGWAPFAGGIHFNSFPTTYSSFPVSTRYGDFWGTDTSGNYYPAPANWTVTDVSGASLALTVTDAKWYKVGKLCSVSFNVIYPTTSNAATALLGTIPSQCSPFPVTGGVSVAGGAAVYTDTPTPVTLVANADGRIGIYAIGTAYTNAQLSGKHITANLSWIAN